MCSRKALEITGAVVGATVGAGVGTGVAGPVGAPVGAVVGGKMGAKTGKNIIKEPNFKPIPLPPDPSLAQRQASFKAAQRSLRSSSTKGGRKQTLFGGNTATGNKPVVPTPFKVRLGQ